MGNVTSRSTIGASQVTNAGATSNDADEELDLYISDNLTVLIDDGNAAVLTDVTAAFDWTRNGLFVLKDDSPAPTGAITITVPDTPRARITFKNETAFDATVTIAGQSETADVVAAGTAAVFASDGSNIRIAGGGGGAGDFVSLSDTPGTIAANQFVKGNGAGNALVFGNPAGDALPFTLSPLARGALVTRVADQTGADYSAGVVVPFDSETYDTDGFHDNSTNNSRITIPNGQGVTKVRLNYGLLVNSVVSGDYVRATLIINGTVANIVGGGSVMVEITAASSNNLSAASAVLDVVDGDYFEVWLDTESDTSVDIINESWFSLEVIETTDTVPSLRTVVASLPARQRYARVRKSSGQTFTNGVQADVTWETVIADTDGIVSLGTEELIVPAGVNKVRVSVSASWASNNSGRRLLFTRKNGAEIEGVFNDTEDASETGRNQQSGISGILDVVPGDAFDVQGVQTSGGNLDIENRGETWFQMELLEFNSSTDAVQAYIAVPPEHKGALLARSATHSIPDAAEETLPWQAATYDTAFDPGDDGPAQRFWLGVNTSFADGDVSVADDEITETAHGYQTGEGPVRLTSSGTLPTGLALATDYWFIRVDADNYKFATSRADALAGTDVDITAAAGGGAHTVNHESKLIVPANVAKVRVKGAVEMAAGTTPVNRYLTIHKNAAEVQGVLPASIDDGDVAGWLHAETNVLEVSEGDVFELIVFQDSSAAVNVNNDVATNFSIEVVEESRAITYPGVTVTPPWRGALMKIDADKTAQNFSSSAKVPWDTAIKDTDGLADTANDQFVIPAGVKSVRASANVTIALFGGTQLLLELYKNGASMSPQRPLVRWDPVVTDVGFQVHSPVIEVVEGDTLEVRLHTVSDSSITLSFSETWFEIEVVETDEAAFPPEPVEFFLNGTPGTSDLVYQKVAARRFSLSDDFAGSEAYLETAPSGGALVFDVDRNGTKIGEIQFADGAKTATFVTTAGTTEVFDVGDRLGIDSPANLFSAADLSIALWAWRS